MTKTNTKLKTIYKLLLIHTLMIFVLAGCVAPSPYYGGPAPVVDRSFQQPPQTPVQQGPIEVTPLERPQPIAPQPGRPQPGFQASPVPSRPQPITPAPAPAPAPAETTPDQGNQAVVALLDSAATHVGGGELDKAAADLERALRIEPRNAAIWHDLGQIRLHQQQYDQAEAMASKSNALAGQHRSLKALNWRLIALARQKQGDLAGADAATAQAVQLER